MQSDVQSDSKLVISICKKRSWSYNRHFYESTSSVLSRGQKVNWKVLLGKEHGKKPSHHSINPWSDCIFSVVYSSSLHFKNMTAYITRTKIDWVGVGGGGRSSALKRENYSLQNMIHVYKIQLHRESREVQQS